MSFHRELLFERAERRVGYRANVAVVQGKKTSLRRRWENNIKGLSMKWIMSIELDSSDSGARGSAVCGPGSTEELLTSPKGSVLWSKLIAKCSGNRLS